MKTVEDQFIMKKFRLTFALLILAGAVALTPSIAKAQAQTTNPPPQDEKQAEFERTWYDICFTKKEADKCYQLSKELIEKFPKSTYIENATKIVKNKDLNASYEKFSTALKAYYSGQQDATKLEQLFSAGEEFLKVQPDFQPVIGHMAIAGASGVLSQFYKNLDKVKGYVEKALAAFQSPTPPDKNLKPEEWTSLRELVLAKGNQYMGYYLIETKGDQQQAIDYLTKATQVKNKDGEGWKDPNNYYLRANIYTKQYTEVRAEYDKLPDDQKTGEAGKALLTKVNEIVDKIIPDYARVLATATKPEHKALSNAVKTDFDSFWKFRTDAPEKAAEYIKAFQADPTVAGPPIPVKADTGQNATAAPDATAGSTKLSTGSTTMAPGTKSTTATKNGNAKSTTKSKSKGKKPKR
jgi:tetratricopeptide (TPR) repeat protein